MIFLILPISLFAWAISCAISASIFLIPVRAVIAYFRAPFSRKHWRQFRVNRTENYGDSIRYKVGIYASLAIFLIILIAIALITISIVFVMSFDIFRDINNENGYFKIGEQIGYVFTIILWICILLPLLVTPLTYIYEYYFVQKKKKKIVTYFVMLIYAVSMPIWGVIPIYINWTISQPVPVAILIGGSDTPIYGDAQDLSEMARKDKSHNYQYLYSSDVTPFRLDPASSPCNKILTSNNMRFPDKMDPEISYEYYLGEKKIITSYSFYAYAYQIVLDKFLQSFTFGISESFGCKFSDMDINFNHFGFSLYMAFFNLFVSVFAVSIFLSPVKYILSLIYAIFARMINWNNIVLDK